MKVKAGTAEFIVTAHKPEPGSMTRFKPFVQVAVKKVGFDTIPILDLTPEQADELGVALCGAARQCRGPESREERVARPEARRKELGERRRATWRGEA